MPTFDADIAVILLVTAWLAVCLAAGWSYRIMRRDRRAAAKAVREAAQADRLAQLTMALGRARSATAVIEASVHEPLHALRADAGMVLLIDEDRASASVACAVAHPLPISSARAAALSLADPSPLRDAVQRRSPVILESLEAWRAEYSAAANDLRLGHQATIAVPVVVDHRVAAILRLDFREARPVASDDREYIDVLGATAADALDRAWQYEAALRACAQAEALRERADVELAEHERTEQALRSSETRYRSLATRTTRMHELTAALSEAVTMSAVASAVTRHGSMVVGAAAAAVSLVVDEGTRFQTLHVEPAPDGDGRDMPSRFAAEPGLCATDAIRARQPVFVSSWDEWQERYWLSASRAAGAAHASSAALPLLVEGAPIGVLEFHFNVPVNFDAEYGALLVSVALHCTQALDRARQYESAQRAQSEAERASRLKDDFLSIVSHELRTPLNAVVGWASMLRQRTLNTEIGTRAVHAIYDNAIRQARLIDDLLDVSRMATGRATLDLQEIDVASLISSVIESVSPTAASNDIALAVPGMPSIIIMGDRRRLEQVFFNLLGNALKFTPAGGNVTMSAMCRDRTVEIRVSDTGVGIDPQFLPHVFDRFRQGDSSPTRTHGGLGLGLSIAKQLVEAHGGTITVDSPGHALGTTFLVSLPLAIRASGTHLNGERGVADTVTSMSDGVTRLDGVSVLVVDDEPDACEVMAHMLRACGARVSLAGSAADALALLASTEIHALLADIAMPGADGYSLIERVRGSMDAKVAGMPAAAVTAHVRDIDREQAFAAGFQLHVAKPVDPADLANVVSELVRVHTASRT